MSKANESAFPCPMGGDWPEWERGITTRELFAAMAMQGFCANPTMTGNTPGEMARYSTGQADALIAELNKPKEPT